MVMGENNLLLEIKEFGSVGAAGWDSKGIFEDPLADEDSPTPQRPAQLSPLVNSSISLPETANEETEKKAELSLDQPSAGVPGYAVINSDLLGGVTNSGKEDFRTNARDGTSDANIVGSPAPTELERPDCLVKPCEGLAHPPADQAASTICYVCNLSNSSLDAQTVHFHQYHVNPETLSQADASRFRISNFLVNEHADRDQENPGPARYRCHECFNTFSSIENLRVHLVNHLSAQEEEEKEEMAPKTEHSSATGFLESELKIFAKKRREWPAKKNKSSPKKIGLLREKPTSRSQPRRQASLRRLVELEPEISDEFNSNSENEGDLTNHRGWRPQRECKSRTKTLVAISLAEQEYEKFDLDFGKFKTEVSSRSSEPKIDSQPRPKTTSPTVPRSSDVIGKKSQHNSKGAKKSLDKKLSKRRKEPESEGRKGKLKCAQFSIKDRRKASKLVAEVLDSVGDYVCLSCGKPVDSYRNLVAHKKKCSDERVMLVGAGMVKQEPKPEEFIPDRELSNYITGAVTRVAETSFNSLHGKLADLKTEDANKFLNNTPNALGLVRLNYSGSWSVKDVWETGGWEPQPDQLTWQPYELAAAIQNDADAAAAAQKVLDDAAEKFDSVNMQNGSSPGKLSNGEALNRPRPGASSTFPSAASLTKKLTSQVIGRQPPIITNPDLQRDFLLKLSKIPWTEQKKIKESFDNTINPKKVKRSDKLMESNFRHPTMPSKLDLKQVGKSVKYSKNRIKSTHKHEKEHAQPGPLMLGKLSGEWETEHSFVCSVCGIEYDDVLEIMHHKWEAHPHCLVTHVSLKHNLHRPPALLYPQVGPSTIPLEQQVKAEAPSKLSCSKCEESFQEGHEFHAHILVCGGLSPWDWSPSKKKRRKGYGGGLKSTIRLMKKSSQSREGTDTDEPSPKKRVRLPAKDFSKVPLVPTHNRTTRFKEIKVKEAKLLQVKERKDLSRRRKKKSAALPAEKVETAEDIDVDVETVVEDVVTDLVEKVHLKEFRRLKRAKLEMDRQVKLYRRSSADNVRRDKHERRNRRSSLRIQRTHLYKEASSEDSLDEERSESVEEQTDEHSEELALVTGPIPSEILETVSELIDRVLAIVENCTVGNNNLNSSKILQVKIISDETSKSILDHTRLVPTQDLPAENQSKRGSKKRSRSPSLELPGEKMVDALKPAAPVSQGKFSLARTQKRQHSLSTKGGEKGTKKRLSSHQPRNIVPLDVKVAAIRRIQEGEGHASVAKELELSLNLVAKWWLARNEILDKFHQVTSESTGSALTSATANDDGPDDGGADLEGEKCSSLNMPAEELEVKSSRKGEKKNKRSSSLDSRTIIPLEIKSAALERIIGGESQKSVSMDLNLNPSTLAHWWAKRDSILERLNKKLNPVPSPITNEKSQEELPKDISKKRHKKDVLTRILNGERVSKVAKSENIPESTLRVWMMRQRRRKDTKSTSDPKLGISTDRVHTEDRTGPEAEITSQLEEISKKERKRLKKRKGGVESISTEKITDRRDSRESSVSSDGVVIVDEIEREEIFKDFLEVVKDPVLKDNYEDKAESVKTKEKIRPRRQSVGLQNHSNSGGGFRLIMPLDVKREALKKIASGESQSSIARDLDLPVSTVASWWRKKESILSAEELSLEGGEDEIEDQTVEELVKMEHSESRLNNENLNKTPDIEEAKNSTPSCPFALASSKDILLKSMKSAFIKGYPASINLSKNVHSYSEIFNNSVPEADISDSNDKSLMRLKPQESSPKPFYHPGPALDLSSAVESHPLGSPKDKNQSLVESTVSLSATGGESETSSSKMTEASPLSESYRNTQRMVGTTAASTGASTACSSRPTTHLVLPATEPVSKQRRSLEFLAKNLMRKALAHTATDSQSYSPLSQVEPTNENAQNQPGCNSGADIVKSGLGLIAESYLSSEEES